MNDDFHLLGYFSVVVLVHGCLLTPSFPCSLYPSPAEDCLADGESYIVPIAVGAALAVLIVIVLVAYFIGRKKSQSSGYESF